MEEVKLVAVGEPSVGKTALLRTFVNNGFPDSAPSPGTMEQTSASYMFSDGRKFRAVPVQLGLWDTDGRGREEESLLRHLSEPPTDVVALCYSIDNRPSLDYATDFWARAIADNCGPDVPVLLVGLKADLRDQGTGDLVTPEEAIDVAVKLNWTAVECSARTQEGLKYVIDTCILLALARNDDGTSGCRCH